MPVALMWGWIGLGWTICGPSLAAWSRTAVTASFALQISVAAEVGVQAVFITAIKEVLFDLLLYYSILGMAVTKKKMKAGERCGP
jgi:hypothetical protein